MPCAPGKRSDDMKLVGPTLIYNVYDMLQEWNEFGLQQLSGPLYGPFWPLFAY